MFRLFFIILAGFLSQLGFSQHISSDNFPSNQQFRDEVIGYVRAISEVNGNLQAIPETLTAKLNEYGKNYVNTNWSLQISIYFSGELLATGDAHNAQLANALQDAMRQALHTIQSDHLKPEEVKQFIFKVSFTYPPENYYSIIEAEGQGKELLGNRIALRQLTPALVNNQLLASQHYLLQVMNPQYHAFMKLYNAGKDRKNRLLRTIYTASSLYTLIKQYDYFHDESLKANFKPIAEFLLSQQIQEGENKGAFYYAFDPKTRTPECHVETGTASKTIYSLINLYKITNDEIYLSAAEKAGNWLVSKIQPNGEVIHSGFCQDNRWTYSKKQSFLYSGQVLSALSRLYGITHRPIYLAGADKIAGRILKETQRQNGFVGDDYRQPNTVSSSWVVMSLVDYAKVKQDPSLMTTIKMAAKAVLMRQIDNPDDLYNHGRYLDTTATSGNGWINEVMGELYPFCLAQKEKDCRDYYQAMVLSTRWLMQNAYTKAISFDLPNPNHAIGGFIRDYVSQSVRTDAVCHGTNSLISLLKLTEDKTKDLVIIPERSTPEVIGLLRIGKVPEH